MVCGIALFSINIKISRRYSKPQTQINKGGAVYNKESFLSRLLSHLNILLEAPCWALITFSMSFLTPTHKN